MGRAAFELVFMLVVLKLPVVYLCGVVWWAIRAEPAPPEEAVAVARIAPDAGPAGGRRRPRRPLSPAPRPHGAPVRTYARRAALGRARVGP